MFPRPTLFCSSDSVICSYEWRTQSIGIVQEGELSFRLNFRTGRTQKKGETMIGELGEK
jgi:hypothetical protein